MVDGISIELPVKEVFGRVVLDEEAIKERLKKYPRTSKEETIRRELDFLFHDFGSEFSRMNRNLKVAVVKALLD